MKGVARGLHTLHSANIIHGSLHQNNVFALNREQGIVGDFDFTKSEVKYSFIGQKLNKVGQYFHIIWSFIVRSAL